MRHKAITFLIVLLVALPALLTGTPAHAQTCPDNHPVGIGRPSGTQLPSTLVCLDGAERGNISIIADPETPCGSTINIDSTLANNIAGEHDTVAYSSASPFASGRARFEFDMAVFDLAGNYTDPVFGRLISYDAGGIELDRQDRNITARPMTISTYGHRWYAVHYEVDAIAGGHFEWQIVNPAPIYVDHSFMSSLVIVDSVSPIISTCIVDTPPPTATPDPSATPPPTPTPDPSATATIDPPTPTTDPSGTPPPTVLVTVTVTPPPDDTATPDPIGTPVPAIPTVSGVPTLIPVPSFPDPALPAPPAVIIPTVGAVALPDTVTTTPDPMSTSDAGTVYGVVTRVYDVIGQPITNTIPLEIFEAVEYTPPLVPTMRAICLILVNLCPPVSILITIMIAIPVIILLVMQIRYAKIVIKWLRLGKGFIAG